MCFFFFLVSAKHALLFFLNIIDTCTSLVTQIPILLCDILHQSSPSIKNLRRKKKKEIKRKLERQYGLISLKDKDGSNE